MFAAQGQGLKKGEYVIEKVLGEGVFGITYLAKDRNGKRVVIKTLNKLMQRQPNAKLNEDFMNRALRLAKCTHPHIVKVHEVFQERVPGSAANHGGFFRRILGGQPNNETTDALCCMVMEYVEGENLWQRVSRQGVLKEASSLHYIRQIGEALIFVHGRSLLHRDVKPQNIILRPCKDVTSNVSTEAVLIDFAIARDFIPDVIQYRTKAYTPGFAPIEEYDQTARRGEYTDVYATAATLYYLLTQKVPTAAADRVTGESLTPPKQINPNISEAVDRAILAGMALEAKNRPQSVREWLYLFESVGAGLASHPNTQPTGTKQNPPSVLGAGLAIHPNTQPTAMKQNLPSVVIVPQNWRCIHTLTGHSDSVVSIAFSPDGQIASGGDDETIKLWQPSSGSEICTLSGHSDSVLSVAFSPDGQMFASASGDGTTKLWQPSAGTVIRTHRGHLSYVNSVAFSPDGQMFASASGDGTIKLWQSSSGRVIRTLTGHSDSVISVAFSPDGQMLASGSRDKTIEVWQLSSGRKIRTLTGHSDSVWSVAFSPDGQTLASGSWDKTIKLWQPSSGKEIGTLTGHSLFVNSVAFSPDGQILASGSNDETIKVWQLSSGREICTLRDHCGSVYSVAFSPDGQTLATGSSDMTIKIWQGIM